MSICANAFREWSPHRGWVLFPSVSGLLFKGYFLYFNLYLAEEVVDLTSTYQFYRTGTGQPQYYPAMMTTPLLFASCEGIRSKRKFASACDECLDFIAVTDRQIHGHPSFTRCGKHHRMTLARLFNQTVDLYRELKMVSRCRVAVYSARFQANASAINAMSYVRMEGRIAGLPTTYREWFVQANREDEANDAINGEEFCGDEVPAWHLNKANLANKIEKAKKKLEDRAAATTVPWDGSCHTGEPSPSIPRKNEQWYFIESESQIVTHKLGFMQSFRVHATRDNRYKVTFGLLIVQSCGDKKELKLIVFQNERSAKQLPDEISTDAGFSSDDSLEYLESRGIRCNVATDRLKHDLLSATGERPTTNSERSKSMSIRWKRGGWRGRNRIRKHTIVPSSEQSKQRLGFCQFHFRGGEPVGCVWGSTNACHNLHSVWKQLEPIGGMEQLMRCLRSRKGGGMTEGHADLQLIVQICL